MKKSPETSKELYKFYYRLMRLHGFVSHEYFVTWLDPEERMLALQSYEVRNDDMGGWAHQSRFEQWLQIMIERHPEKVFPF